MNIIIDSSKVPAFSLCVFKGNQKIYEELCFSGNKLEFDIGAVGENDLYFEWSFALEKNEKKALKKRADCPPWNLHAKEPTKLSKSFFNSMFEKTYPNPAEGIYITQIMKIPKDLYCLHLAFRGTKLYKRIALLDVSNEVEDRMVDISFRRKDNVEEIKAKSNKRKCRFMLLRIIEWIVLFSIGVLLEEVYPNIVLIFLLSVFLINEFKDAYCEVKYIKGFLAKINDIQCFKEPSADSIVIIE